MVSDEDSSRFMCAIRSQQKAQSVAIEADPCGIHDYLIPPTIGLMLRNLYIFVRSCEVGQIVQFENTDNSRTESLRPCVYSLTD